MQRPLNSFTQIPPPQRAKTNTTLAAIFATFVIATLVLGFSGGAILLQYAFPAASLALGWYLYVRHPSHYLAFVWWLFFLTPEVRRIVDWQIGWNPLDPTILAPLMAGMPLTFTAVRELPTFRSPLLPPLLMIVGALFYGFIVGLQSVGVFSAGYALWNWLMPVATFFYIVAHHEDFASIRAVLIDTFVWGGLIMGLYGIIQFFFMPPWDAYWIISAEMQSVGLPFPQLVRVFSTLNSPGPFAVVITASLLIIMTSSGRVGWWAITPTIVSFLLSLVRGAWVGFTVALLYLLFRARRNIPTKAVAFVAIFIVGLPVLLAGPVGDRIADRMDTLTNLAEDNSYQSRAHFYDNFLEQAFGDVAGSGLGVTGLATKLEESGGGASIGFRNFDSGLMEIPLVFGWPGTFLFGVGMIWLLAVTFVRTGVSSRNKWMTSGAIVLGTLSQILLGNVLAGVSGMVVWCFLGMVVAERAHAEIDVPANALPAE